MPCADTPCISHGVNILLIANLELDGPSSPINYNGDKIERVPSDLYRTKRPPIMVKFSWLRMSVR